MKIYHGILTLGFFAFQMANAANESGNGGFAYQVSFGLLTSSSRELVQILPTLPAEAFRMIEDTPNYRERLTSLVTYENLDLRASEERSRMGRPLAMDYTTRELVILKPFFVTYAGTWREHAIEATRQIQRELLHEAAHVFGLNEHLSTLFSGQVMQAISGLTLPAPPPSPPPLDEALRQEARSRFRPFVGYLWDYTMPCLFLLREDEADGEYSLEVVHPNSLPNRERFSYFAPEGRCPFFVGSVAHLNITSRNEITSQNGGYLQILDQTNGNSPRISASIARVAFGVLRIWGTGQR